MSDLALAARFTHENGEEDYKFLGYYLSEENCELLKKQMRERFAFAADRLKIEFMTVPVDVAKQFLAEDEWKTDVNVGSWLSIMPALNKSKDELLELCNKMPDLLMQYSLFVSNTGQDEALQPVLDKKSIEHLDNARILVAGINYIGAIHKHNRLANLPN